MQRGGLLIWTVLMVLAVFAVPFVFLIALLASTSAGDSSSGMNSIRAGLLVALTGLFALLFVIIIREIQSIGRRWNSPMYYPAIWTFVTGFFAGWFVLFLPSRPWESRSVDCNLYGLCINSSHIEAFGLILTWFFGVLIFGPVLRSVFDLYSAWRIPPARFVYRRRRH